MRRFLATALVAGLMSGVGCGGEPETPEQRVRASLAEVEAAVEAADVGGFRDFVSDRYQDARGNDKRALVGLLLFERNRSRRVHVVTRLRGLEILEDGRAQVSLTVGMAGSPLPSAADAARLRADVFAVELDLVEEGDRWRVVWADWRPAPASDLLQLRSAPDPASLAGNTRPLSLRTGRG